MIYRLYPRKIYWPGLLLLTVAFLNCLNTHSLSCYYILFHINLFSEKIHTRSPFWEDMTIYVTLYFSSDSC